LFRKGKAVFNSYKNPILNQTPLMKIFAVRTAISLSLTVALILSLGCNQHGQAPANQSATGGPGRADQMAGGQPVAGQTGHEPASEPIVYVDSDSLLSKYDYYKKVRAEMQDKGKSLQADMQRKGRSFQAEVQAYQKNAVNLTPDQKKATEERLGRKQQELQTYQQTLSQQLGKEEQDVNSRLYDKVQTYLREYCLANKHKMVMTYSKGGNLLYGDKGLDVTSEVVKGLNQAYAKENVSAK